MDKTGVAQAKEAGKFLASLPVEYDYIYSSDLNRTIHTAAIIARKVGLKEVHTDKRLRPLDVGLRTGLSKKDHPIDEYIEDPNKVIPGGESIKEFENREDDFNKAFISLLALKPKKKGIIVGHLSTIVYWTNQSVKKEDESYSNDIEDIIHPGGVVAITTDFNVIPLLGENEKAKK